MKDKTRPGEIQKKEEECERVYTMRYEELTTKVIGKCIKIHKNLGMGFLEKVYENALIHELESLGVHVSSQQRIDVYYEDKVVGTYTPDIIIDEKLIIELKATNIITSNDPSQLRNYLKASKINLGLIINFGNDTLGIRRIDTN